MPARELSELEGVCLGLVRKNESCTAYHLRQQLKSSPSSHWQASAGSVYPLLSRLIDERMVSATPDKADGRGRRLIRITPKGSASLKKWLLAGTSPATISSVMDPIRSRTYFLDVLSVVQRTKYINELVAEMERYLQTTKTHLDTISESAEPCAYLGALGAMKITEARLDWLRHVRKALGST